MRAVFLFVLLAMGALVLGCAKQPLPVIPFEDRLPGMFPGTDDGQYEDYRLGLGDEVELFVQRHPEFSGRVAVETSGDVVIPTSFDRIKAAGMTLRDLENAVIESIDPYVLNSPRVYATLEKSNSRFVYVLGAVRRPGKYSIEDERLDLREAIIRAGMPLDTAALKRTRLVSSSLEHARDTQVDLKRILYQGDLTENYEMRTGDIVFVPHLYLRDMAWWMSLILRPFQLIVNTDSTIRDVTQMPTAARD